MRIHRFIYLCIGLLGVRQPAAAIEPSDFLLFSWDPVTLKPQVALTEVYNDNLFAQPSDKTADLITMISPGLVLLVGQRSDDHLLLSYTFNQYLYADRTDLNTSEHLIDFTTNLEGDRLSLRGTDRVQFLSSPLGNQTLLEVQSSDLSFSLGEVNIDRTTFLDSYTLTYRTTEKTSIYAQGLHSRFDYEDRALLFDLTTYMGTAGFGFQAFPKTVIFGEGYYGTTTSEPNPVVVQQDPTVAGSQDVTFIGGGIGARGSFTPKITGIVKVGYEAREIEDSPRSLPSAPVVNLSLTYQYSPKTTLSLNYVRRQDVSVYFEQQSYTSDVIGVQAVQALGSKGKWRVSAGGYYALYDYSPTESLSERNYSVVSAYFNLAYQLQLWLSASLGYERTSILEGSADIVGYDVNRVTLRLSMGY
jgi:hypothetical protein